ncbi:type II toxin-antitoxin system HipA family toxin [Luteolibacter sp. Populi]|uniref:type II toxin-antitoxin system HipA family toxin n=1 Tax=Luteolibacter sp. Populi TaxID=3230487 RepID=UPI003465596E
MSEELSVIAEGRLVGRIRRNHERLQFRYDPGWQAYEGAYPLSLSMPLVAVEHEHAAIDPFLRGLLPDNAQVLEQWGRRYHVSHHSPFKLLWHVGEDCAGAVQFVPHAREDELLGAGAQGDIQWLTEEDLAGRIQNLLENHGSVRNAADRGQFSLAGAQPKTALYRNPQDGRWGVPSGHTPTTHILKPSAERFAGYAENEHFCLALARGLGLRVPDSTVIHPGGRPVIVVTRYDRTLQEDGRYRRIHQEDFCQALGVRPGQKYENEGGPSARAIADLLRDVSSAPREDVALFAGALAFNWLIAGTDAHAKNYSLLIAARRQVRLAPLYDLASALPYPRDIDPHKAKLAMKIGSKYRIRAIGREHWVACARGLGMPAGALLELIGGMAERLPDVAVETAHEVSARGIEHPVIGRIVEGLGVHVRGCRERLVG